jgi:hypothetical protein
MYKKILTFIAVAFISLMLFSHKNVEKSKTFYVWFEQDTIRINLEEPIISLEKKPFKIFFEMSEQMSISVNASFSPNTYNKMTKGILISDIETFNSKIIKEKSEKYDLLISEDRTSAWYCFDNVENNFDKCFKKGGKVVTIKDVNTFIVEPDSAVFAISEIDKTLFMSFVIFDTDSVTGEKKEFQRETVKIKWLKNKD